MIDINNFNQLEKARSGAKLRGWEHGATAEAYSIECESTPTTGKYTPKRPIRMLVQATRTIEYLFSPA